jgi:hypothetical protein
MKALGASNFKHDWFATSVVRLLLPFGYSTNIVLITRKTSLPPLSPLT